MKSIKLRAQLEALNEKRRALESKIAEEETRLRQLVSVSKTDRGTLLEFKGRKLTATRNRFGRLSVKENGRVVDNDYLWGINSLRLAVAEGRF